jgi:hypothetical protein
LQPYLAQNQINNYACHAAAAAIACRTAHHPSQSVTHHLVCLARSAHQQLSQLLLLGPDAPLAQQQLQQEQRRRAAKKLKHTSADDDDEAAADPQQQQQQQQREEMTALARAWRAVCGPNLGGLDAWVLLRQEALPFAARADALAAVQLQQQLKQQRRRGEALLLSAMEAEAAAVDEDEQQGKRKKRKLAAAANGAGSNSSVCGALVQLLHGGVGQVEAPKASRAVLRSIPEQVRGAIFYCLRLPGFGLVGHTCFKCQV